MAEQLAINVTRAATATPAVYTVPGTDTVEPLSAFAHFDGTAAAASFRPALTFYSDAGIIIARVFPGDTVVAGDTADVTFAPFLDSGVAGSSSGGTPIVGSSTFAPVGGFQTITSTTIGSPDTIVTSPTFAADGLTTYRIDFGVAAMDLQRIAGTGHACIFELVRSGTNLGIIGDFNLPFGSTYASWAVNLSVFDTPPASASTSYTIGAEKSLNVGATATCLVYGSNVGPPYTNVTHPGYIAVYEIAT